MYYFHQLTTDNTILIRNYYSYNNKAPTILEAGYTTVKKCSAIFDKPKTEITEAHVFSWSIDVEQDP